MTVTERKYALSKVDAGDYVLPSNDGQTFWRISRYRDGPSYGIVDWDHDRDFWGVWRLYGPVPPSGYIDMDDWSRWEFFEGNHNTRAAAVEAALQQR